MFDMPINKLREIVTSKAYNGIVFVEHGWKEIENIDIATQSLSRTMMQTSIKKLDILPDSERELLKTLADGEENKHSFHDEYEEVTTNLHSVCRKLDKYARYVDSNLYKDTLTNTQNKAAYKNAIRKLDDDIKENNPRFSVAFFDLNGLEHINAHYGFETGDELMRNAARILKKVFGNDNVFRVAGDEFIAIMRDKGIVDMDECFQSFDYELKLFNESGKDIHRPGIAKGSAVYDPNAHESYRHVFIIARENLKNNKIHTTTGITINPSKT